MKVLESLTADRSSAEAGYAKIVPILEAGGFGLRRIGHSQASPDDESPLCRMIRPAAGRGGVTGGLAPWQIRRTQALMEARLEARLTTSELAAAVRLSKSHFATAFRQSFGEPPHLHLMKRRVERARHLMRTTDASLPEIALACGFSDQSHLSRLFRRLDGDTPSRWRRRARTALRADPSRATIQPIA